MKTRSQLPNQSVVNAFIIWRVPASMPIKKVDLLANITQDVKGSATQNSFYFNQYSRRATPKGMLKFLLERKLLSEKGGLIYRNDRTKNYIAKLPPAVVKLIDSLPVSDPLILLAGAGDED